jgi:hypothetical protein
MSKSAITYGRGGAGEPGSPGDHVSSSSNQSVFAGNVTSRDGRSPSVEPDSTPTLKSKTYTTGRGGTGNMAKNDSADEARRAQDVDVQGITLPEGTFHTGRGAHSPGVLQKS